jgi:DNA-directed RNA polymerase II subunit RPB1
MEIGFLDKTKKILECVCFSCGKLKVDESNPKFVEALRYRDPKSRLTAVWNVAKTKLVCDATPPAQDDDPLLKDAIGTLASHGGCGNTQPTIRKDGLKLYGSWKQSNKDIGV